jgi:hypothetical protein
MDILLAIIFYLMLVFILANEGRKKEIGFRMAFVIGLLLTPLIALPMVVCSRKKIIFHHFVKLNHNKIDDRKIIKTIHQNGDSKWVEMPCSELNIV